MHAQTADKNATFIMMLSWFDCMEMESTRNMISWEQALGISQWQPTMKHRSWSSGDKGHSDKQ